ncbi:flavin reductase family protein [Streptomyces indonesiensis]
MLLASGIGITPFIGYLETLARSGGSVPEVVLHHGSRNSTSHAFRNRTSELRDLIRQLRVHTHYSRPEPHDVLGRDHHHFGRISAADVDARLIERRARFYLCGPEDMLSDITIGLVDRGVPRFDIFAEKFHVAPQRVDVPDSAQATVRFTRANRQVTWRKEDGTLLQLAEREGIRLPSGCRLGQCESCAITVLDGQVAHLVTCPEDLADDQCLTCQAMPMTDVTLDA